MQIGKVVREIRRVTRLIPIQLPRPKPRELEEVEMPRRESNQKRKEKGGRK